MNFDYSGLAFPIREDIVEAHRFAWRVIAQPGNWWTGAERVAIAQASREARHCALCAQRKAALSPFSVTGTHDSTVDLAETAVDAVHRIVTDPSRLTESWLSDCYAQGLSDGHYVELLGIVVTMVSIDAFHRALGISLEPLPGPEAGEPSNYRPPGARNRGAWVDVVFPEDLSEAEADLYGGAARTGNVISAMSLVPDSVRLLTNVASTHYLEVKDVANPESNGGRAITRAQIELIAGRVSSLSDCFY